MMPVHVCIVCRRRVGVVPMPGWWEWVDDVTPRRPTFACLPCSTVDLDEE